MERIAEVANVITYIVCAIVLVGAVKCITGDLTFGAFVDEVEILVGATAIGRGLAAKGRILGVRGDQV